MDSPHSTTMVILSSTAFEEFQKAFDSAKDDLRWIRAVTGHEYAFFTDDVHRFKRNSNPLEALLSSFGIENVYSESDQPVLFNDIDNGDAWYSNFRNKECKNGDCIQRTFKYSEQAKKRKRGRKTNVSLKVHKPQLESVPDMDDDEDEIPENIPKSRGKTDPDYDDYDNMKNSFGKFEKKLEKFRLNEANGIKTGSKFQQKYLKNSIDTKRYEQNSNDNAAKEVNYDFIFDKTPQPAQGNSQGERIELKDQVEKTQNDLSHEADYKLSKIEQEAMEKKSPNKDWPLKHPDYQIALLMQQKDHDMSKVTSNSYDQKRSLDQEGFLDDPNSLDPEAEIKLKVSSRLMGKGLSPSLPSDALRPEPSMFQKRNNIEYQELNQNDQKMLWSRSAEDTKNTDNLHREHRRNKRDTLESEDNKSTGRKLMTLNDYDSVDSNRNDDGGNENKEIQGSQDSIENSIKEVKNDFKSPTYYNPDLQINNIESSESILNDFPEKLTKDADGLTIDFSDALLKSADTDPCPSCADPSKLVKVGSKSNQTKTKSENNETCGEYVKSGSVITINKAVKLPAPAAEDKYNTSSTPKSNTDSQPNPVSIPNSKSSSNSPSQVSLKFGVAFNVTVLNGSAQFEKSNPSLDFGISKKKKKRIPGYDGSRLLMINKRGIIFPPLPAWLSKRDDKPISSGKSSEESGIDFLMSGKLTAKLVNAVLHLVKENEEFCKDISPGIRCNKVKACTGCNNLSGIKTDKNCDKINKSEEMLREVMETISSIIEREVQSKMCVPLCPTLKNFYKMILQSRIDNEKKTKRRIADQVQNRNKIAKREANDEPTIRRKYSVVKKLLNQYTNLPNDDQDKAKDAKDLLQVHLAYLNDLERAKRRIKRNIARNILQPINVESHEKDPAEVSPEFVKLVKTAEIMTKSTHLDDEPDYTFLQEDDYS